MSSSSNIPPPMPLEEWKKILEFDRKVFAETGAHFIDLEAIKMAAKKGGFDYSGRSIADLEDQLETNERRAKKEIRVERENKEEAVEWHGIEVNVNKGDSLPEEKIEN